MTQPDLEIGKILGTSTKDSWSQIHSFSPRDSVKLETRGQLLAAISLVQPLPTHQSSEIVALGREMISRFHEEYFGDLKDPILVRAKETLAKVAGEVPDEFKIEIVVAVFTSKVVYLVTLGEGKVFLKRNDRLEIVCRGEGEKIQSSSGYLEENDLFFWPIVVLMLCLRE
jgi:hypothetical protein